MRRESLVACGLALLALHYAAAPARAQVANAPAALPPPGREVAASPPSPAPALTIPGTGGFALPDLSDRKNVSGALQLILLLTVLSLAPALLILMTSFTRIVIVLALLRQALGTQNLPPNPVLIGLSVFMTFLVMAPTLQRINAAALRPYLDGAIDQTTALDRAAGPARDFMIRQVQQSGNDEDVLLFHDMARRSDPTLVANPRTWGDVGTLSLIPGFVLSELKTAFLMGFRIYLPFLVIDMVVSAVLISMGMMMLPPVLISLPFKLLLFVLVDGWRLVVENLMGSFV